MHASSGLVTNDEARVLRERAVAWVDRHCSELSVLVKISDPLFLAEAA